MRLEDRLRRLERQDDPGSDGPFILVVGEYGKPDPTPEEIDAEVERRGGRGAVCCVLTWDPATRTFT